MRELIGRKAIGIYLSADNQDRQGTRGTLTYHPEGLELQHHSSGKPFAVPRAYTT